MIILWHIGTTILNYYIIEISDMKLYSDGACSGNPGPGGYGAIFFFSPQNKVSFSKGYKLTTNNRMELLGVIAPLEHMTEWREDLTIEIITDSQYVANAINKGWLENWVNNGWKTSGKKKVKNKDLWERFLLLLDKQTITIKWVKGHDGHPENEECDRLAVAAISRIDEYEQDIEYEKTKEI